MSVKLLTEHNFEFLILRRGCTGSAESTLVKKPHYWKSHVTAQLYQTASVQTSIIDKFMLSWTINLMAKEI